MSASQPPLEVASLTKKYGEFTAVNGVSFVVPRGAVIGLLGPNGAGKTTTIQMLMGITTPTSGTISYFGQDFTKHKQACLQRINYTSAYNHLQERISVEENLLVFARLYEVDNARAKIAEMAEFFGITDLMDVRFRHLSAGQQTRVNIAKALLNDPELVMMDEPTASLDPDIRDKVMELIEKLRAERGISLLYTSHNMDEVSRLCDEVIFLDHGNIVRQASPQQMALDVHEPSIVVYFDGDATALAKHFADIGVNAEVDKGTATLSMQAKELPRIIGSLDAVSEITINDIEIRRPNLEEAFLHYTRGDNVLAAD